MIDSPREFFPVRLSHYLSIHVIGMPLLLGMLALYAHESGLDFRLQNLFFDPTRQAFPWRRVFLLELIGHDLLKSLPIGLFLVVLASAISTFWIERLRPWRTWLVVFAIALCIGPLVITSLKHVTAAHCPWDLRIYGGYAEYTTHWLANANESPGLCLPSGHSGAGFSLLALYFAGWAAGRPTWRWWGLCIGINAGIVFSVVRIVQGAHFLSHGLWSAMFAWFFASIIFLPLICLPARSRGQIPNQRVAMR